MKPHVVISNCVVNTSNSNKVESTSNYSLLLYPLISKGEKSDSPKKEKLRLFKPKRRRKLTSEYVNNILDKYYPDATYDRLPGWIKTYLTSMGDDAPRRNPTGQEMLETIADAKMHRKVTNSLELEDFEDQYKFGTSSIFSILS